MVDIKGVHLLRFAGAANKDKRVNFPHTSAAVTRVLSHIDIQDQTLLTAMGTESYGLVSAILSKYPKQAPACISLYETCGLTYGDKNGTSVWYGRKTAQLWHVEPANDGPIVTDGSKVNGFCLLHVDYNKYLCGICKPPYKFMNFPGYELGAAESSTDASVWTVHLTAEWKFVIQSQDYHDRFFVANKYDVILHHVYRTLTWVMVLNTRSPSLVARIKVQ